jgi:serine/threonine protein kinase/uncharacterized tellurite resistance protein B-like protein
LTISRTAFHVNGLAGADSTFAATADRLLQGSSAMSASGGQDQLFLGGLLVEGELGTGGMGKVYRVRSQRTGERFAMKMTRFGDWEHQRLFLLELMTWYGLPPHPHLVACRFFRTLQNQIAIFAEVVDGGSLADWIHQGRLTSLEQILDVAIQFAWGLHVAHELGVVHQDVKPGNVLLTSAGLVKVADFGLAKARAISAQPAGGDSRQSVPVTAGGMTRAYCSPEQYDGRALTRKTDIWSWAVSVLEMFMGEWHCDFGTRAPAELEKHVQEGPRDRRLPTMPSPVAGILRKCFRPDPAERWVTMAEVCDALTSLYRPLVGRDYFRELPPLPDPDGTAALTHDRRFGNVQWQDPKKFLRAALTADGRDPGQTDSFLPAPAGSRRAQVIADLIGYEEAVRIFQRLIKAGGKEQTTQFANLCAHKALVHESVDDSPGALALYDQAIALYERLVHQEGRWDLAKDLASTYQNKARALRQLGELRAALALYDQAIALYERLVHPEGRWELANVLAGTYENKAAAQADLGELRAALALYDQAIALYDRLVHEEGRWDLLANDLARTYQNKANGLRQLGELRAALALYDQAIAVRERLVQGGRWDLAKDLARTYQNKAIALQQLGDPRAALALYDQAIALDKRLVHQEGRWDLAKDLARTYQNKAIALQQLGDPRAAVGLKDLAFSLDERLVHGSRREKAWSYSATVAHSSAVALYDQAIGIYERLLAQEERWDLANDLAKMYQNKAVALKDLGELRAAVALYDQAIAIHERLVDQEGRWDLANDLARAYENKAIALAALGERRPALALYDQAIALYERLVHQEGRWDLARAYQNKANALMQLGEGREALALYNQAIALRERLVSEGRENLGGDLAWAKALRAFALLRLGELERARPEAREAMATLQAEVARTQRADLKGVVDWATKALREVL